MTDLGKAAITKWILNNPGYVYSKFSFKPEHDDEVLPTMEEFESLLRVQNSWSSESVITLLDSEKELYPNAIIRQKYNYTLLDGELYAHVFLNDDDKVLYVVILTR